MARKKKSKQQQPQLTAAAVLTTSNSTSTDVGTLDGDDDKGDDNDDGMIKVVLEVFETVLREDYLDSATPKQLVGAIDQGTSSTRFLLFSGQGGRIVSSAQMEHAQLYPQSGWHEHDPATLWHNTAACIRAVGRAMSTKFNIALNVNTLAAIGITNQRETVIAWNRVTGQPYHNAIVWDDARTADIAACLAAQEQSSSSSSDPPLRRGLTAVTGLPISSYFAGTKVKWLLDHVEQLRVDVKERPDEVCFGTVDTWLLFQLTGSAPISETTGRPLPGTSVVNIGGTFCTDVTNASRWLFMDLQTCQWDVDCITTVCAPHTLPVSTLPEICPSSFLFGRVHADCGLGPMLQNIPLAAVLGDQQAALFGQAAHSAGQAKNTYGTGLFLMMNTGTTAVRSTHGLLTTVAYQLGRDGAVHYALEGSVSHAGATIQWLRDQLGILQTAADSETLARTVSSNDGLYFCPAFAGLLAPHWRSDARGCLVGMTASHHKGHVCRAALEAMAYQTMEVFQAIEMDSHCPLQSLKVDGGGTHNKLLMQFQADIINVPVVQPVVMETTAMGAAFCAGLTVGVWHDLSEIEQLWAVAATYVPTMSAKARAQHVAGWTKAVSKSLGWVTDNDESTTLTLPHATADEKSPEAESSTKSSTIPTAIAEEQPLELPAGAKHNSLEEEEKKSQEVEESKPADECDLPSSPENNSSISDVAYVGEVDEVSSNLEASIDIVPVATRLVNALEPANDTVKAGYSRSTLALTAGAALGIGILLGSGRKR